MEEEEGAVVVTPPKRTEDGVAASKGPLCG